MPIHILLLLQPSKYSSDSSLVYLKQTTADSFFSLNNPILYSALVLLIVLAIIFIFYKYVIAPMRSHFISEKRDLEHQHTQSMAALAEHDPDPVLRFDSKGKIVMANQACSELFSGNYLIRKNLPDILPEFSEVNFEECIKEGSFIEETCKLDAKYYNFIIRGIPELNIGQVYGSDITELKTALKKSTESEKIKSFFLSQMSHEIRTPINAIMGFNSILRDNTLNILDSELQYSFEAIDNSCLRLIRTIDQLLDMSQLQSGSYVADFERINLPELVEGVVKNYQSEANSKNLGLHYINRITDHPTIVKDKYSVTQILSSLLDNAVKYSNKGDINVVIDKDESEKIKISVSDNGIGMSLDYQGKIFSLFSQEQMGYNRRYEGNGLGLALSKKFADLNDISIEVNSVQDEGSTFTIIFN